VLAWANRQLSATSALVEEEVSRHTASMEVCEQRPIILRQHHLQTSAYTLGCTFSKHSRIHFVQIAPRVCSPCLHHSIITCFRQQSITCATRSDEQRNSSGGLSRILQEESYLD
jgi:hypothetical protein